MNPDNIALIDLDGTVADFDAAMRREEGLLRSPHEVNYDGRHDDVPAYVEARRTLIKNQPGFWRDLAPIHLGMDVVEMVRRVGFALHVLTKGPRRSVNAWTEKAEWSQKYLPDAAVTITQDKSLVYGRVLVDDWPPYFNGWLKVRPRGLVIAVAQPWNGDVSHPNVIRYDGKNYEQVRDALKEAYDRPTGG